MQSDHEADHEAYEEAVKEHARMNEVCERYAASKGTDYEGLREIQDCLKHGLYQHWKSTEGDAKFYLLEGVNASLDALLPFVMYRSLYGGQAGKLVPRHLVHSEYGFLTPIKRDVYTGARFVLVAALTESEIFLLRQNLDNLKSMQSPKKFLDMVNILLGKEF